MHTTNYQNAFIEVAEDTPVQTAEVPPVKEKPTIAGLQYNMVSAHPYKYTSDDVIFSVYATKNDIPKNEWKEAREIFFSKGQACMRSSPLTKRYGWGVHSDAKGKVAIYGLGTPEYKKLSRDKGLEHFKAMRSKKAG